jgi:hypothetical protein
MFCRWCIWAKVVVGWIGITFGGRVSKVEYLLAPGTHFIIL